MSELSRQATNTAPAPDALCGALRLSREEASAMGDLFVQIVARFGLQGRPIFDRLEKGQSFARALDIPEGAADVLYFRAHQWFSVGRIERAEALFRALCVIAGQVADHWVGYGVCLKARGLLPEAGRAFETASVLRPDWAIPHFHLLECLIRSDEWERARLALEAFDNRVEDGLPAGVIAEAERFRMAIALRQAPEPPDSCLRP